MLFEDLDIAFARGTGLDSMSTGAPTVRTKAVVEANEGATLSLSGLLSSLDWAAAPKAQCVLVPFKPSRLIVLVITDRLLFATTNHIERIDPVLSRPGRMDIWVNFTNATRGQAERLFKNFFQTRRPASSPDEAPSTVTSLEILPDSRCNASVYGVPILEAAEIAQLAKRFADAIPEGEMSVWPHFLAASVSVLTQNVCSLRAYKGIYSGIQRVLELASRGSLNGLGWSPKVLRQDADFDAEQGTTRAFGARRDNAQLRGGE